MTLEEARVALERGRPVVLVTPPAVDQGSKVWELLQTVIAGAGSGPGIPVLLLCGDHLAAAEWAAAAPAEVRVHAVTGLAHTTRLLKERRVAVLAGAVADVAALVARAAVKVDTVSAVVVAWPEGLVSSEQGAALDALLGEARDARRIVLSWNPSTLADFLERHARRALLVGTPPLSDAGAPLGPIGPARYVIVPAPRRPAALRQVLVALDPARPLVWNGGALPETPVERPDAVLCTCLPTREQFAALARLGEPTLFITTAQLPYIRSLAAPLAPLHLPTPVDRAQDRAAALRDQVAQRLGEGDVDAELALLGPLFERFDPAEVAAALLAINRQAPAVSAPPATVEWVTVFVNLGKKDRVAAKDLVGALIREVGMAKSHIGRIDVRDRFALVEIAPAVAPQAARGLTGVMIKGRRAAARLERPA